MAPFRRRDGSFLLKDEPTSINDMKLVDKKPDPARITVVIAVHNRLAYTQRCIHALKSGVRNISFSFVVIDDGSNDGTADWLASQSEMQTIKGDGNLWFGGATALGFQHILNYHTRSSHVLILNNDTFIRPGAVDSMLAATKGDDCTVVAAAYWTEDRREANSAGFRWKRWQGLRDVSSIGEWVRENRVSSGLYLPADGVATTLVLIPMPLLQKTKLPDPQQHPHNRYDAVLSARMRKAGARLLCSTELLADHRYGPDDQRPTVRKMKLGRFLNESFSDRRSVWHLAGGCAVMWEVAPNPIQASWAVLLRIAHFLRQLAWVTLNSIRVQSVRTEAAKI